MFSTRTNRVTRTITRSAATAAMVAPLLTFGAQSAMAGGDPAPAPNADVVKTEVVYDCKNGAVNLVPVLTNPGAPRTVLLRVEAKNADVLVWMSKFDLTTQFVKAIPVNTNESYMVEVMESVGGIGNPTVVTYDQTFAMPKNCDTNHHFTATAAAGCEIFSPVVTGSVTNTGDSSDAYTVEGTAANGTVTAKTFVVPSGATTNWTIPMAQSVKVSSNAVVESEQFGPFSPEPCAVGPNDDSSDEGSKDPSVPHDTVPSSTPDSGTTGAKPTLPPPATVPPTVVTVPPTVVPDTVPETTTTVAPTTKATLPAEIGTPQSSFEEIPAMAEIPEIQEIGLPVHVLGEIVTAQPAPPAQVGSDTPLAFTGTSSIMMAAAAASLMAAGAGLVAATRRRRNRA